MVIAIIITLLFIDNINDGENSKERNNFKEFKGNYLFIKFQNWKCCLVFNFKRQNSIKILPIFITFIYAFLILQKLSRIKNNKHIEPNYLLYYDSLVHSLVNKNDSIVDKNKLNDYYSYQRKSNQCLNYI